jgi:hypothetical protein
MDAEVAPIRKLLEISWDGPMWQGVNLMHILKDISRQRAFAKTDNATNNIYEYVEHMNAWRRFTIGQLRGNSDYRIEINSAEDWPTDYEATETNWQKALQNLEANQAALLSGMDNMSCLSQIIIVHQDLSPLQLIYRNAA